MILCKNLDTGHIVKFKNVRTILKNINRDRSGEWTNYTKHDWKEGLEVFTEYKLLKVTKG